MDTFPLSPSLPSRESLIREFPPMVAMELRRADRVARGFGRRYLGDDVPTYYIPTDDELADTLARMRLAHTDTLALMDAI